MTNTTEAVAKESRDDDDVCAEDRNNNDGVDDTKWGEEGGAIRRSKTETRMTTKMTKTTTKMTKTTTKRM